MNANDGDRTNPDSSDPPTLVAGRRRAGTRSSDIPVSMDSLPMRAREQLEAKIARFEKRTGGPVEVRLYRASPNGRVNCKLIAGDGRMSGMYLLRTREGSPSRDERGLDWWHHGG